MLLVERIAEQKRKIEGIAELIEDLEGEIEKKEHRINEINEQIDNLFFKVRAQQSQLIIADHELEALQAELRGLPDEDLEIEQERERIDYKLRQRYGTKTPQSIRDYWTR